MHLVLFGLFIYASFATEDAGRLHEAGKLSNALLKKRERTQCPEALTNKENIILSPNSDSTFSNKAVYGCHQTFLSKGLKFTNCILHVYSCNFTNANSDKNAIHFSSNAISSQLQGDIEISNCQFYKYCSKIGGSIYIFSSDVSKTVSISNCFFNSDNTKQSEKGGALYINAPSVIIKNSQFMNCHSENGGCLYYTNENNNQATNTKFSLNVKRCIFKNNKANSSGGSLYLMAQNSKIASTIEVKGCKFTNNYAENGCDISYLIDPERSPEGEKLTITKNTFSRNTKLSTKLNVHESFIYTTFNQKSKIEFTKNQVKVDQSFNEVFLFDYPEGITISEGQLKVSGNIVNPSFANQIDRKKMITSQFDFHAAQLLEDPVAQCDQRPSNFNEDDIYECNQRISTSITTQNKQLLIDLCTFTNFKSETAVNIEGNSEGGIIRIKRCKFILCQNGAIKINKASPQELKISECTFTLCKSSSATGSAIHFTSNSGTIENCKFYHNSIGQDSGEIHYASQSPGADDKLTITGCFFENMLDDSVFLYFTSSSKFELSKNNFKIYNSKTRIFKCPDATANIKDYKIEGNTLYPLKNEYIGLEVPENAFDEPPISECPGLPGGVENTGKNEQCGATSDSSDSTAVSSNTIVSIYYSTFNDIGNKDVPGGAVFISLPENMQIDQSIPVEIYYSIFSKCNAKSGCGIYAKSLGSSRLFDIKQCTFYKNNNNANTDKYSAECLGAAIYIESSSATFKLSGCIFKENEARNGAGIYYTTATGTSYSQNLLEEGDTEYGLNVKDCVFTGNLIPNDGGSIYINVDNAANPKPIEINSCSFLSNSDNADDSVFIESNSKTSKLVINNCDFISNSIIFNGYIGTIDDCRFNDIKKDKHAIKYKREYKEEDASAQYSFGINRCNFTQSEDVAISLVYFETELSSKFSFTYNNIKFQSSNSHVLDHKQGINVKKDEYWHFSQNAIDPNEYSVIKTITADDIPADCGDQFLCPVEVIVIPEIPPPSENCSAPPNQFNADVDFYACKQIIKEPVAPQGQLLIDHCNFTNFKENAIKVDGYKGDGNIIIDVCNFVYCQNGAITLNNVEAKELRISHCYFISCQSTENGRVIEFTSKRGIIQYCKFLYNKDTKTSYTGIIYYKQPTGSGSNDYLSIQQCYFEYDSIDDSTVFFHYESNSKFEFMYNVFKIYNENTKIFEYPDGAFNIKEYTLKGNTLYPFEDTLIGNDVTNLPRNAFIKPPESECPGLPEGVENTGENDQCANIGEESSDTLISSATIVSIYYSSFKNIGNENSKGGAVCIILQKELSVNIDIPVQIYYTTFIGCNAATGCGIYAESLQPSRVFEIHQCTFSNGKNNKCEGAGIYIKSSLSTFNISRCLFKENKGSNGAGIYYTTDETSNSQNLLLESETKYGLNVQDCVFISNQISTSGGAIYINVNNVETPKPILINSCIFLSNLNDESASPTPTKYGGAIYYSFGSQTVDDNLHIFKSIFKGNEIKEHGGSVYIKSTKEESNFTIDECEFVGDSIVFNGYSGTIDKCQFKDISTGNHAIYYNNENKEYKSGCSFNINGCEFDQTKDEVSLIYFATELASNFSFTNNNITFPESSSSVAFDLLPGTTVKGNEYWNFDQNTIYPAESSSIKTEAAKDIPADCGFGFLCGELSESEEPTTELSSPSEQPTEDSSSQEESLTESESPSEEPPTESESPSEEPLSESESPSEEPPSDSNENCVENNPCNLTDEGGPDDYIELKDRNYSDLHSGRNGAAIRLINYTLRCINSNFTSCKVTHGGGAIFIVYQKLLQKPIHFENLTFKYCEATYGGAVYIFTDKAQNEINIINCIFDGNVASKKPSKGLGLESHLYGGTLYLQASNSNITNCDFIRSVGSGLKILNDVTGPPTLLSQTNEEKVSISIAGCKFEAEKDSTSSSIFYVRGPNYEAPIEVKDCIFTGELKSGTYHIDGDLIDMNKKEKKSKLRIMSCKFSSSEEMALNRKKSLMLFESFDESSQTFNYKDEEVKYVEVRELEPKTRNNVQNTRLSIYVASSTGFAVIAAIAAMSIIIKKRQEKQDGSIDDVIELNAAEL